MRRCVMSRKRANFIPALFVFLAMLFILSVFAGPGEYAAAETKGNPSYSGVIRVYVVEPASRWNADDDMPYHYGCLDFIDVPFTLPYQGVFDTNFHWNGSGFTNPTISQNNIMIIASIFHGDTSNSYVEATAAAKVDTQWNNTVNQNFTHTVLVEEGTGSWCQYCPDTRDALDYIYEAHTYPFFYVAMIEDKVVKVHNRLVNVLHLGGYPTCFFDGGYQIYVGGDPYTAEYESRIRTSGARDPHLFDFSVALSYLGGGQLGIDLHVVNNEVINTVPTAPGAPTGPYSAVTGKSYNFNCTGTDPDDNTLSYRMVWAPGDTSDWYGPYNSGEMGTVPHTFSAGGVYFIKAQSKDQYGGISGFSGTYQVIVHSFLAGDANGSGAVNIQDVTYVINALYKGGPAPIPPQAGDANGNGTLNIQDVTYLINFLYKGGLPPNYPPGY
jgi:Dockerin type I domain